MEYQAVFEFSFFDWSEFLMVAGSASFALIGMAMFSKRKQMTEGRSKFAVWYTNGFVTVFTGFAIFLTLLSGFAMGRERLSLRAQYQAGEFKVVEGVVEDFVPEPYEGHQDESFTVNGVPFSYSYYNITPGFSQSASHGGPIRTGLPVRISYIDNLILKLEVGKPAP